MLYNYYFDVAALISGLFLLTVYTMRRTLRTRSNRFFSILLVVEVVGCIFDIVSCYSISYPDRYPVWFNYFTAYGYLFFYNAMGILFLAYIDSKTRIKEIFSFMKVYIAAISVFELILIVTSYYTHIVSYFDVDNVYRHGQGMTFLYAMAAIHLLASSLLFVHERKKFNKYQVMAIVAFIVVVFLGVLIQAILPTVLIGQFGCTLVLFFIYTSLENPVYHTYRATTCYNRRAFLEVMKSRLRDKEDINIFTFAIRDFDNLMESVDYKVIGRLSSVIAEYLSVKYKTNAFIIADDMFLVLMKSGEEEAIAADLKEFFSKPIQTQEDKFNLRIKTAVIKHVNISYKPELIETGIVATLEKNLYANPDYNFDDVVGKITRRKLIAKEIERAIDYDLFDVYYQPIRDVKTNKFSSSEALIRLKSSSLGFISPEEFIPIAENEGLIIKIGEIVFEKVCAFIKENNLTRDYGVKYIEINMSTIQCMHPEIVTTFKDIMNKYEIDPKWINLEITETAGLENDEIILDNIKEFSDMGIAFSIDDYGSGFASAEYLFKFPVELVKIDKGILWQAMKDVNAGIVLMSTMRMLHDLGKKIVVEGVEDDEMVVLLEDTGCDYMQGYYYSKPLAPFDYLGFLKAHIS